MLDGPQGETLWQHWRSTLEGAPPVLQWATDYRRPANFTGRANVAPFSFPGDTAARVNALAKQLTMTPTAVVMAAMQVFIARSTNQREFLVGSPFSGREHRKFEDTVGFFVNMLPIRADLTDRPSFSTLVKRVGQTVMTALEHERFPFAQIVRRIQPPRDPSRSPLFQVSCTFEKAHVREESGRAGFLLPSEQEFADFGGLQQESYYIPHPTCHYDVEFIFEQTEDDLRGMIVYCKDLFSAETAERMSRNFERLLLSLLDDPSACVEDASWQDPAAAASHSDQPLQSLADRMTDRSSNPATVQGGFKQTHGQLQANASMIAANLIHRGIKPGDLVPVIARRGAVATTAMLGVIRSGAAVVPIDAEQPAAKLADLIADTECKLIIVDKPSQDGRVVIRSDDSGQRIDWVGRSPRDAACGFARTVGVRDLHIRIDGTPQRCDGSASSHREYARVATRDSEAAKYRSRVDVALPSVRRWVRDDAQHDRSRCGGRLGRPE